jgi:AraC-like DNA-binding protein
MAERDRERLARAWERYQARRRRADERRLEENEKARQEVAKLLRKLLDEGYSMGDLGRELGMSRQAIYDLLRRAKG